LAAGRRPSPPFMDVLQSVSNAQDLGGECE
jgi:hypothetical protein